MPPVVSIRVFEKNVEQFFLKKNDVCAYWPA